MRYLVGRRDVEVNSAADDARRDGPEGDVADKRGVAAEVPHPPLSDQDRQRYADDVHQPVIVDEEWADVEAVARRAGYEAQRDHRMRSHARKTRPHKILA